MPSIRLTALFGVKLVPVRVIDRSTAPRVTRLGLIAVGIGAPPTGNRSRYFASLSERAVLYTRIRATFPALFSPQKSVQSLSRKNRRPFAGSTTTPLPPVPVENWRVP